MSKENVTSVSSHIERKTSDSPQVVNTRAVGVGVVRARFRDVSEDSCAEESCEGSRFGRVCGKQIQEHYYYDAVISLIFITSSMQNAYYIPLHVASKTLDILLLIISAAIKINRGVRARHQLDPGLSRRSIFFCELIRHFIAFD